MSDVAGLGLSFLGCLILSVMVRVGTAKLNLRDTVSKGRLLSLGRHVCGADEEINTDGAVVDLDAVQGCSGLLSLVGPVEDDSRASRLLPFGPYCMRIFLGLPTPTTEAK